MLKGVKLEDRIEVPSARQITDAGQMIVPCAFARTGAQVYSAGSLGLTDQAADAPVTVMRDELDVFDEASLASFRSAPVTIGHPKSEDGVPVKVTADNANELQVGMLEGMPTRDEDTLTGTLVISRKDAIDHIESGTKELSAGYTCDLEMVDQEDGTQVLYQRNIRANHIAIVGKGRAGSMCAIADESESAVEDSAKDGGDGLGKNDDKPQSAFDEASLATGIKVEMEHTEDAAKAESIAKDHLTEDPEYYTKLAKMEAKDESDEPEAKKVEASEMTLDEALAAHDQLKEDLAKATSELAQLTDELDASVEERVNTILVAKDLTDLNDFTGKSVQEIKAAVVKELQPKLDISDRSDAYVAARFDILAEDADMGETPMGRLLRDNVDASHLEAKPSNAVAEARQRSIDRHKTR